MSDIKVASRYAKALLELSLEKNALEAVISDFKTILSIAEQNKQVSLVLDSPIVNYDKKFNILKALLGKSANAITISFFDLVTRKKRSDVLLSTSREFLRQYNEYNGIQVAEITTTLPLTKELRQQIIEIVKEISGCQKVELIEKLDKNLIAGFVLKVNDKLWDDSLSGKLRQARMRFAQRYFVKLY
ncbi:ATP synthase F1 subunit delta [Shivajiella indica]|uniref:ATP synthase subunit delta n=1 Tax=Shivajiella indica TaxID=872115 RepID=A0ABW5B5W6_9BACT